MAPGCPSPMGGWRGPADKQLVTLFCGHLAAYSTGKVRQALNWGSPFSGCRRPALGTRGPRGIGRSRPLSPWLVISLQRQVLFYPASVTFDKF